LPREEKKSAANFWSSYVHPSRRFFLISHIYTKTKPAPNDGIYQGAVPEYTLYMAREQNEYPPILICDPVGLVNPRDPELCLEIVDEKGKIENYLGFMPKSVNRELIKILEENCVMVQTKDEDGKPVKPEIEKKYASFKLFFMPIELLKADNSLSELDWGFFIERLIRWDSEEKDQRINHIHKAQLLKGINPRLNVHSLIVLNAGVGKSIHFIIHGINYDKVKKNSFLGYAKSPKEIFKGTVDGSELPIGIDQIEIGEWDIMDFMFNVMEYGEGRVSSGAVDFTVRSKSPIALMANPIGESVEPEKSFGAVLNHISKNPAIGRRLGIIAYSRDYTVIKTRSTEQSLGMWRDASRFFRAVEQHAKKNLVKIMEDSRIWNFIMQPIPGYADRFREIASQIYDASVRTFLLEHSEAGQSRVRCAALQASLVDNLRDIALGRHDVGGILEHAEEYLNDYVQINIESAANLARNLENELAFFAKAWFENTPDYLKEIIYAVEEQRRQGILGNTFYLNTVEYKPRSPSYQYLSQCTTNLLQRKRGITDLNNGCRKYFNFCFEPEGKEVKIIMLQTKPTPWLTEAFFMDLMKKSNNRYIETHKTPEKRVEKAEKLPIPTTTKITDLIKVHNSLNPLNSLKILGPPTALGDEPAKEKTDSSLPNSSSPSTAPVNPEAAKVEVPEEEKPMHPAPKIERDLGSALKDAVIRVLESEDNSVGILKFNDLIRKLRLEPDKVLYVLRDDPRFKITGASVSYRPEGKDPRHAGVGFEDLGTPDIRDSKDPGPEGIGDEEAE